MICLVLTFFIALGTLHAQTYDFLENPFEHLPGRPSVEARIVELVNSERVAAGLQPLTVDTRLQSAARQHSTEMLELRYFSHYSPTKGLTNPEDRVYRTGISDAVVGENIAVHSVDGNSEEVARQLMIQWMNSPAHKANILKPEFTHLGVGIASLKDSTRRDTVIHGAKGHVMVYTIRHYGTQVFSQRHIRFDELKIVSRTERFVVVDLLFQFDRTILASIGNFNRFFKPDGAQTRIHLEFPADSANHLTLAAVQNDRTSEYAVFFENTVNPSNFLTTFAELEKSSITVLDKDIRMESKTGFFLVAKGQWIRHETTSLSLYQDADRYYELGAVDNRISFNLHLDTEARKVAFAIGPGTIKEVGQRLHLQLTSTSGDVFGKGY